MLVNIILLIILACSLGGIIFIVAKKLLLVTGFRPKAKTGWILMKNRAKVLGRKSRQNSSTGLIFFKK